MYDWFLSFKFYFPWDLGSCIVTLENAQLTKASRYSFSGILFVFFFCFLSSGLKVASREYYARLCLNHTDQFFLYLLLRFGISYGKPSNINRSSIYGNKSRCDLKYICCNVFRFTPKMRYIPAPSVWWISAPRICVTFCWISRYRQQRRAIQKAKSFDFYATSLRVLIYSRM